MNNNTKEEFIEIFEKSKMRDDLKHAFKQTMIKTKTRLLEIPSRQPKEEIVIRLINSLMYDESLVDNYLEGIIDGLTDSFDKKEAGANAVKDTGIGETPLTLVSTDKLV